MEFAEPRSLFKGDEYLFGLIKRGIGAFCLGCGARKARWPPLSGRQKPLRIEAAVGGAM